MKIELSLEPTEAEVLMTVLSCVGGSGENGPRKVIQDILWSLRSAHIHSRPELYLLRQHSELWLRDSWPDQSLEALED